MSSYRVAITASAEQELHRLPAKAVARMMPRLEHLAPAPLPPGCKKLKGGDNEWPIRVGDYRIVCEIDDTAKTVDVTRIAHQREVYDQPLIARQTYETLQAFISLTAVFVSKLTQTIDGVKRQQVLHPSLPL